MKYLWTEDTVAEVHFASNMKERIVLVADE